ncbi:MAG: hypothetical protein AAF623_02465 [Planctomycetota bacterium]
MLKSILMLPPALLDLYCRKARGKLNGMAASFRSPRRIGLSLIALCLGLVWTGQAILGILVREPADPEQLTHWIPMSLFGFLFWNILKVSFQKPEEPFDWTPAEKEWLMAAPLNRSDLIRFRFTESAAAAAVKAGIFATVMIPDLNIVVLGFSGMLIGLLIVELLRMCFEIFVYGFSDRQRSHLKWIGVAMVVGLLFGSGKFLHLQWQAERFSNLFSFSALYCCQDGLITLANTQPVRLILIPFTMLTTVMLSDQLGTYELACLSTGLIGVGLLREGLVYLDASASEKRRIRESRQWDTSKRMRGALEASLQDQSFQINAPIRVAGVATLAWRQWKGVVHYRNSIFFTLAIPFCLAMAPAFDNIQNPATVVVMVVSLLACYSLLLLPAALKFDFRRDIHRINMLKELPISSVAVSLGQLVIPFLVTTLFQVAAIVTVWAIHPFSVWYFLASLVGLIPFNFFIYCLENLMFLWFPYRVQGEGIQILIRSILAFTAKGMIFAACLASLFLCRLMAQYVSQFLDPSISFEFNLMATVMMFGTLLGIISTVLVGLISRAFHNLDPSRDLARVVS